MPTEVFLKRFLAKKMPSSRTHSTTPVLLMGFGSPKHAVFVMKTTIWRTWRLN